MADADFVVVDIRGNTAYDFAHGLEVPSNGLEACLRRIDEEYQREGIQGSPRIADGSVDTVAADRAADRPHKYSAVERAGETQFRTGPVCVPVKQQDGDTARVVGEH